MAWLCLLLSETTTSIVGLKISQQRQHYYDQMTRYIAFANQLSRYAPLQLWQSIMRGEAEAKIEYKRKNDSVFLIFRVLQSYQKL